MDATNFNNDKPEVAEKFEYMEDVNWVMSVASSTQSPQTKHYLAKKSGWNGIQVIIINLKWFIIFIILSF
jgi:hypothetical protein